jgi:hypothetical protein
MPGRFNEWFTTESKKQIQLKSAYFGQIFAEYASIPREVQRGVQEALPPAVQTLVNAFGSTGMLPEERYGDLKWADLAIFEDAVLANQDLSTLRRKVWHLRARFSALVGPEIYHAYQDSRPPDPETATTAESSLRADLRRILGLTHWFYSLSSVRERIRSEIGWRAGAVVTAVFSLLVLVGQYKLREYWKGPLLGFLALVVGFGVLGAFVSFSRRLYQSSDNTDPVIGSMRLLIFKTGAPFTMLSGGIFSLLLYLILLGNLLSGGIFPGFTKGGPLPDDAAADWARMFVWAFIAGFAERLVPDTLDQLVGQGKVSIAALGQNARSPAPASDTAAGSDGAGAQGRDPSSAPPDEKDIDALIDLYQPPVQSGWQDPDSDPNRGKFGGSAANAGWELTAVCTADSDHPGVIMVSARVKKTSGADVDCKAARFYLSPEFQIRQTDRNIVDGEASLRFPTHYPFVLGAELSNPEGPKLELDLKTVFPAGDDV